jgi:glycosyltransferase involved in cell wall biosynthesis
MILVEYLGKKGSGPEITYNYVKHLAKYKDIHMLLSRQNPYLDELYKLENVNLILINTELSTLKKKLKFFLNWISIKDKVLTNNLNKYESIFIPMISLRTQFIVKFFHKNTKIVFCVHDPKPHKGDKFKHFLIRQKYISKKSNILIFHSRHYEEFYKKLYLDKEIRYIPLFSSKNNYKELKIIKSDKIYFVFFGRITKYKGIKYLLEAFVKLALYSNKVNLIVAGEGIVELPNKLNDFSDRIQVINKWVDENTISEIYSSEKCITVLPYIEGTQSGVIVKSFEYCVPVIITNIKGLKEQIQENHNGFIVEKKSISSLYNQMKFIVDHNYLITKMRDNINNDLNQGINKNKLQILKDVM